ncbi:helix-turn-helix domain-containing protein [Pseudooceanicola sp. CBS1P-1]|uniref:Helix-turn-helix domain-containing protein n=1 Tax=Pseudooceanicola albus TaxID=2692189 RepID=A0A6L7G3R3_9RHOB|nr:MULTISPECIES: helix-turn-helix domain-containing protein [Pseudooceanicola]MBT9385056.1 helix-turn-helix domain-containing protein [Pseudooceanicola endophyticus]MXN18651.1 helix-turn-helix domain-containing protein [Pseudooceanicola albus]
MMRTDLIPAFTLFGETGAFPDVIHCERIWDRARLHDWVISPHRHHEMVQVFFMRQGAAKVRLDGRDSGLQDGDFLFVPAGIVHAFQFRKGCEGLVLSFPATVIAGMARASGDLGQALRAPFSGQAPDFAVTLMDEIAQQFASSGTFRATRLVALAHALFATLAADQPQDPAPASPADLRMRAFEAQVAAHLGEGWRVADHARALGITPGHLTRICRAATGLSASRYLETAVMTEAARLLAFTRINAAEIGYRLGFEDPSYFSRRFRALRGETPSAYRARVAG